MQQSTTDIEEELGGIPDKVREGRERLVLKLIIKAYRKICEEERYPVKRHEVWFSAVLKGCIDELCSKFSIETGHQWHVTREYFNDDEQILMGHADPNAAPRIDIVVTYWLGLGGKENKFPFECKRIIEHDTELIKLYIREGLKDRYLNKAKDYSAGQSWGGMIAYILQGSHNTIVDKLNEQIDIQLNRPTEHLTLDNPIEDFEAIYKSRHQHPNQLHSLTITHLFLTFGSGAEETLEDVSEDTSSRK